LLFPLFCISSLIDDVISVDDETLIAAIIAATPSEQPRLAILDARPRANAVANQAKVRRTFYC
jgi:hypothetical protein